MNLVRWDPFRELEDVSSRWNRLFHREGTRGEGNALEAMTFADWAPRVDIKETPEAYLIRAELPDVKKEDVKITVKDGVLAIEGERKFEKEEKGKKYHRVERAYGTFYRSFALPENVDEKKLAANYKDGMLELHLMKSATEKPRATEIKIS